MDSLPKEKLAPYIFLIGFNKTGTRSFHEFFVRNGLRSLHWESGSLAYKIAENIRSFVDPIQGFEEIHAFSDIECVTVMGKPYIEGYKFFKEFFFWHPNSKFILNTRNVEDWLRSRCHHESEEYLRWYKYHYACGRNEVLRKWRVDYYEHHLNVLKFFRDKPESLLTYDIDRHQPSRIVEFLRDWYSMDHQMFQHVGKTGYRSVVRILIRVFCTQSHVSNFKRSLY